MGHFFRAHPMIGGLMLCLISISFLDLHQTAG